VPPVRRAERDADLETAYCAEIVAVTYEAMGLLPGGRRPGWYDAGRFWSGDDLRLSAGARLGGEIAVQIPATQLSATGTGIPDDRVREPLQARGRRECDVRLRRARDSRPDRRR